MVTIITIFHVLACVFLVLVVLLQQGKGADMGAVFGGSSSTIFGSSGAGNFLTRLTTGMAALFMVTSLALTYMSARRVTSTVFDAAPLPEPAPLEQPLTNEPAAGGLAPGPMPEGVAPQASSEPHAANPPQAAEAQTAPAAAAPAAPSAAEQPPAQPPAQAPSEP